MSSVKQRRPTAYLWGYKDANGLGVRRSPPMEKLICLCCMTMQCPVEVWPESVNGLEWFVIDTAASYMTVNLTKFCDVLNYDQRPILTLGSRFENVQVKATGCLGKFRKLVLRDIYNHPGAVDDENDEEDDKNYRRLLQQLKKLLNESK